MSYKTVYYTPYNIECYSDKSFKPIIRQTELIDKTYTYTNCPVFNHQSNRTFVLLSPIDFSFSIKRIKYIINSTNTKICATINVIILFKEIFYSITPNILIRLFQFFK